jgi:hypothetical protein
MRGGNTCFTNTSRTVARVSLLLRIHVTTPTCASGAEDLLQLPTERECTIREAAYQPQSAARVTALDAANVA